MRDDDRISFVPLTLSVSGREFTDDADFDQKEFLRMANASEDAPKSSCPPPIAFCEAFGDDGEDAYGITLSSRLSGSYNSAVIGAAMAKEDVPGKNVHVFDSKSAACGQTLILLKLKECLDAGMGFLDTVAAVERYISEQVTVFVLDRLDALKKNGRLSGIEGALATALNIKPILGSTPDGDIQKLGMARGMKQGLKKLADMVGGLVKDPASKVFAITHCNAMERALWLKDEILSRYPFKDVLILDAAGVSTLYAQDGGIVCAF